MWLYQLFNLQLRSFLSSFFLSKVIKKSPVSQCLKIITSYETMHFCHPSNPLCYSIKRYFTLKKQVSFFFYQHLSYLCVVLLLSAKILQICSFNIQEKYTKSSWTVEVKCKPYVTVNQQLKLNKNGDKARQPWQHANMLTMCRRYNVYKVLCGAYSYANIC